MEEQSYRKRGTADCPISVYKFTRQQLFTHWHPEPEIILVLSGKKTCRVEEKDISLVPGDILIINPNQLHSFPSCSDDHTAIHLIFSTEALRLKETHIFQTAFLAPWQLGKLMLPSLLQAGHPAYDTVYGYLLQLQNNRLYEETHRMLRYAATVGICAALIPYRVLSADVQYQPFPEGQAIKQAIRFMLNKYAMPLSLKTIADHVHLHPNYLCTLFKKHIGCTVWQYLIRIRVDAAKFLLQRDDLPMPRVAELSGFSSERVFYRQFRNSTGMTPKIFQIQQRNRPVVSDDPYSEQE